MTLNTARLLNTTGDPNVSNTATPTIQISGEMGVYRCWIDGTLLGDYQPVDPIGHYNVFISAPLADGSHSFTFDELSPNAGGPPGFPCQPYPFSVDTRIPTAPVITRITVGAQNAQGTYPLTVTGTVTADEGARSVRVYKGVSGIGGASVSSTTWTAATYPPLASGEYDITATASDAAGNVSVRSAGYHIIVGTPVAPTVPGAPTAGSGTVRPVNLQWTTPPDGGAPITRYVITYSVQAENSVGDSSPSQTVVLKVNP